MGVGVVGTVGLAWEERWGCHPVLGFATLAADAVQENSPFTTSCSLTCTLSHLPLSLWH